jgi:hypothetical protein
MIQKILEEHHDTRLGGHMGSTETLESVRRYFNGGSRHWSLRPCHTAFCQRRRSQHRQAPHPSGRSQGQLAMSCSGVNMRRRRCSRRPCRNAVVAVLLVVNFDRAIRQLFEWQPYLQGISSPSV